MGNKIFATLGYPDAKSGMVNLTPDQQHTWVREHPGVFVPVKGAWGMQGSTTIRLEAIDEETLGEALTLGWQNAKNKGGSGQGSKRKARKRSAKPLIDPSDSAHLI